MLPLLILFTFNDVQNQPPDNRPPYSAPTPGVHSYSAPTPGAIGAPTPGASGLGAPTPAMYGAPTPGNYSAPTPSFARTPGVAATPFVPGGVPDVVPLPVFSKQVLLVGLCYMTNIMGRTGPRDMVA